MPKKGYKQPREHRRKIAEGRKGKRHSEETKQKIAESMLRYRAKLREECVDE